MKLRCKHLGLIAGLALALSVSASEWSPSPALPHGSLGQSGSAAPSGEPMSPAPAPVLFLAGGVLGLAAMVRWRQRTRP